MHRIPAGLWATLALGCGSDIAVTGTEICDGVAQAGEDGVDSPFDKDGDGFFDAGNPDCADTYAAELLDCDDLDPEVNPGQAELGCDGIDNDCDPETKDALDADADGYDTCTDCDDNNNQVHPNISEVACNGLNDDCDDSTPDSSDGDGDGYADCPDEDCDDNNNTIHPGAVELKCNGVDDDCNADTPDADDVDGDGSTECDDCDDNDADNFPGNEEVCDDDQDNDCDDEVDEDCVVGRTGSWELDKSMVYSCALGSVSINFDEVFVEDDGTNLDFTSTGSGFQPGKMEGAYTTGDEFAAERVITGTCNEIYKIAGEFTSDTEFSGSFSAKFVGGALCLDCSDQSWFINGTQ